MVEPVGLRVYHLGNSHTDAIREELAGLCAAAGDVEYGYGTKTIPGAPIRYIHSHPGDSFEEVSNNHWDALIIQTYNSTSEQEKLAIVDYVRRARQGNANVRVILYTIWPDEENWDNPSFGRSEAWTEEVKARLESEFPGIDAKVAPTSLVIRRMGNAADAGQIPHYTGRRMLYKDAGHIGYNGAYGICGTMLSMLYNVSPLGLPYFSYDIGGSENYYRKLDTSEVAYSVPEDSAAAIQEIIMDTLAEYEHDGVDTGPWIVPSRLDPALADRPYTDEVQALGVEEAVVWEMTGGSLPAGLQFQDGEISGTPTEIGSFDFTVKATAGELSVEREINLAVAEDLPLTLPEIDLGTLAIDEYVLQELQAAGAVGQTTWALVGGEMPPGFSLKSGGLLKGTPGETGSFEATLEVSDSHPDGARTTQGILRVTVNPLTPDIGIVRQTDLVFDRKQPFHDHDLSKLVFDEVITDDEGDPIAEFALAWFPNPDYQGGAEGNAPAEEMIIAVRILQDSAGGIPLEGLHLYLDPIHNREVIYNEDDQHVMFERGNQLGSDETRAIAIQAYQSRPRGVRYLNEDGSWELITTLGARNEFSAAGVHTKLGPNTTYGFDIAIGSKDDASQRYYWRGNPGNDTDTSHFGSIFVAPPSVLITYQDLLPAEVAEPYSHTFAATSGPEPYMWHIIEGPESPASLTLNTSTGELAGTPDVAGSYVFTLEVTDNGAGADSAQFTLNVISETSDIDGNGLRDRWEVDHFGDIGQDPGADPDEDGVDTLTEQGAGSDPTTAHSDSDGLDDGTELALGRDPAGLDRETLDWIEEFDGRSPGLLHTAPGFWSFGGERIAEIHANPVFGGDQGLEFITEAGQSAELTHYHVQAFHLVLWTDFMAQLQPFSDDADPPELSGPTNSAFYLTESGQLKALSGSNWQTLDMPIPEGLVRYTLRQDFQERVWEIWINGELATPAPLGFRSDSTATTPNYFRITQASAGTSLFDAISVSRAAPPGLEGVGTYGSWAQLDWHGQESAPTGNPNRNNLSNLQEYAFGFVDPVEGSHVYQMDMDREENGSWVEVTYRRYRDAEDIAYMVQTGSDLENWSDIAPEPGDVSVTPLPGEGDVDLVTVRIPSNTPGLYVRVITRLRE